MICSKEKEVKYLNISHATRRNLQRRLGEISRGDSAKYAEATRRNKQRRLGSIWGDLALYAATWRYMRRLGLLFEAAWFTTICFDFFMNENWCGLVFIWTRWSFLNQLLLINLRRLGVYVLFLIFYLFIWILFTCKLLSIYAYF